MNYGMWLKRQFKLGDTKSVGTYVCTGYVLVHMYVHVYARICLTG